MGVATWVRELFRIFLRLREAAGAGPQDELSRMALSSTGRALMPTPEIRQTSAAAHAAVAARCVLGLSRLRVFVSHLPCVSSMLTPAESADEDIDWVICD